MINQTLPHPFNFLGLQNNYNRCMINGVTVNPNASLCLPDICCLLGAWLNRMRLVQILKAYHRIKSVIKS